MPNACCKRVTRHSKLEHERAFVRASMHTSKYVESIQGISEKTRIPIYCLVTNARVRYVTYSFAPFLPYTRVYITSVRMRT